MSDREQEAAHVCCCDIAVGEQPYPDCVFDTGEIGDCRIAKRIKGKHECEHWQPVKFSAAAIGAKGEM